MIACRKQYSSTLHKVIYKVICFETKRYRRRLSQGQAMQPQVTNKPVYTKRVLLMSCTAQAMLFRYVQTHSGTQCTSTSAMLATVKGQMKHSIVSVVLAFIISKPILCYMKYTALHAR